MTSMTDTCTNKQLHAMYFMFEFRMRQPLAELFVSLIPEQREVVNELMHQGRIHNYVMDTEQTKIWATVEAVSEAHALKIVELLPMTEYMRLSMYPVKQTRLLERGTPKFSVN